MSWQCKLLGEVAATRGKQQHTQITHLVFGLSSVNNLQPSRRLSAVVGQKFMKQFYSSKSLSKLPNSNLTISAKDTKDNLWDNRRKEGEKSIENWVKSFIFRALELCWYLNFRAQKVRKIAPVDSNVDSSWLNFENIRVLEKRIFEKIVKQEEEQQENTKM